MVHLSKDRYPVRTYSKLSDKKIGPCEILRKIDENAYVVDLPENFNISSTFNITDLRKYYPPEDEEYQLRIIIPNGGPSDIINHKDDQVNLGLKSTRTQDQSS